MATKEPLFTFTTSNIQIDGVTMGFPLGPILAYIFLLNHENCPIEFPPNIYIKYVDDTFVPFE